MDHPDEDMTYEKMQHDVKMFLTDFPMTKLQLEEHIQDLYCTADKIEKIHKDCTIAGVVAGSTGVVSGILTVIGFALVPVTAGGSLILSLTGMGLGAAATATGISASIIDNVSASQGRAKLDNVEGRTGDILEALCKNVNGILPAVGRLSKIFKNIVPNFRAFSLVKAKPGLSKTFQGTLLAMTKGARIRGAALTGVFVLMDIVTIVQDSVHLSKGAKAPTAEELREKAQHLKEKLQALSEVYETLLEMETQLTT
ncbi:apolipoprotein L2-like [Vombatus ursinus]|uniref:apolipoprotein L2-like n=1 Tax=Vombatus ursinus TaxID=29139 RepID=UPI000FFDB376|nr:apolipoprotein L2-like [Vombatus ursinus]